MPVPPPSPGADHPSACFSLVEALVIVFVMGTLAVLLLPTLGEARRQAAARTCASQLAQLGAATTAYAADNDEVCLPYWAPWRDPALASWFDQLIAERYLPQAERLGAYVRSPLLVCPANPNWHALQPCGRPGVNYAMNQGFARDLKSGGAFIFRRLGQVVQPDLKVVLGEPADEPSWGERRCGFSLATYEDTPGGTGYYHQGRTSAYYADGHTEGLTLPQMAPPPGQPWWYRYDPTWGP
jgi:prepilin-type processing-associated H-X9-DG protein